VIVRARVLVTGPDEPLRRDAVVEFRGGRVAGVRDSAPGDRGPVHDVVLPGLIDAHSHARAVPLSAHGIGSGPLERFLIEARELTPLPTEEEALAAADNALAAGITSVQVLCHDFGDAAAYARRARAVAAGYAAAGIRAFIALGLTDQDEYTPPGEGLRRFTREALTPGRGVDAESFPEVTGPLFGQNGLASIDAVGPVAPQWCSDQALQAIAAAPGARRVHAHLLECARQRLAPDPVSRLKGAGLLFAGSSFAHGVWLDDDQMGRLARAGATVVHCPGSNARLGVGTCPVRRLLDAGVAVALGLDSNGAATEPDMFAEMRAALRAAAVAGDGAPLTAAEVLAMATAGGARALGRADLGVLRPGAAADAVALDLPGVTDAADPVTHVVEHAGRESVAAVWVAGRRARHSRQAAAARSRILAILQQDAPARTARLAAARPAWRSAGRAWQAAEQRGPVTPASSREAALSRDPAGLPGSTDVTGHLRASGR
jgi:5-methylthioadenosine/S-adenosylhomocysteine deaminase